MGVISVDVIPSLGDSSIVDVRAPLQVMGESVRAPVQHRAARKNRNSALGR
jgi:hypothetical protein